LPKYPDSSSALRIGPNLATPHYSSLESPLCSYSNPPSAKERYLPRPITT
jgi:hypothetical protein